MLRRRGLLGVYWLCPADGRTCGPVDLIRRVTAGRLGIRTVIGRLCGCSGALPRLPRLPRRNAGDDPPSTQRTEPMARPCGDDEAHPPPVYAADQLGQGNATREWPRVRHVVRTAQHVERDGDGSCVRLVRHENIPARPASDWSVMRIYPRVLRPIGPS
eukprot:1187953-Prorocentrum_minimum.AAC.1